MNTLHIQEPHASLKSNLLIELHNTSPQIIEYKDNIKETTIGIPYTFRDHMHH